MGHFSQQVVITRNKQATVPLEDNSVKTAQRSVFHLRTLSAGFCLRLLKM
jgi:hypothetical protein